MASVQTSIGFRAIDEILVDELGWRRSPTRNGRAVRHSGDRLRAVARGGGRIAYVWEVDPGERLPDADSRRSARDGVEQIAPGALLIFRDFLCRREIWQWEEEVEGFGILREVSRRPMEDDGRELAARLRESGWHRPRGLGARAGHIATENERIIAAVLRLLSTGSSGVGPVAARRGPVGDTAGVAARELERLIRTAGEARLRELWRALRRLTLLDPACGGGDRLLGALRVLTMLCDAVLERMSAFVTDRDGDGVRPRTRSLPDFRQMLEAVPGAGESRRSTLTAWVIANNLFGADPSPAAVRSCRARLGRRLRGACPGARALLRLNVRAGEVDRSPDPLRGRSGSGISREDGESLAVERAVIDRSVRLLRGLATTGEAVEWSKAVGQIEQRIHALERAVGARAWAERGIPPDRRSAGGAALPRLSMWIAYPGRERRGQFDIVLGGVHRADHQPDGRPYAGRSGASSMIRTREEPMVYPREWIEGRKAASGTPARVFATARLAERGSSEYPSGVITAMGAAAPEALHLCGDARNLTPPLVGLFCSGRMPPDLVLPAIEIVRAMSFAGSPAAGGFHTPVEKEWLRQLLESSSRVVLCRARGLAQRRLPKSWDEAIRAGTLTLVSTFDEGVRRPTLQSAGRRNELVGALATAVFVAHASPAGMTYQLARSLVDRGVPVFTLEHPSNHDLLRIGAETVRNGEELVSRAVV